MSSFNTEAVPTKVFVMAIAEYEKMLASAWYGCKPLPRREIRLRVGEILHGSGLIYDPSLLVIIHDGVVELYDNYRATFCIK